MILYRGDNRQRVIDDVLWCVDTQYATSDYPQYGQRRQETRRERRKRLQDQRDAKQATEAILQWHREKFLPVYGDIPVPDTHEMEEEIRGVVLESFGLWLIFSFLLPAVADYVLQLLFPYLASGMSEQLRTTEYGRLNDSRES